MIDAKQYTPKQPISAVEWNGDQQLAKDLERLSKGHIYLYTRNLLKVLNGGHMNGNHGSDLVELNDYIILFPDGAYGVMRGEEFEALYEEVKT